MNKSQMLKELEQERKKLNKLIDEALANGTPLCGTQEIIEQSRRVNDLVEKIQEEISKENQQER